MTYSFEGGSGYAAGQILTVVQAGAAGGTFTINTVDGSGIILTMTKTTSGTGYTVEDDLNTTVNTGGGSLATISVLSVRNHANQPFGLTVAFWRAWGLP